MIKKFLSTIVIVALLVMTTGILNPTSAMATSITTAKDVMTRIAATTASNHEITFVTPTGVAAGQTITLTFGSFGTIASIAYTDVDFAAGDTGVCSSANFTEKTLGSSPATTTWGVSVANPVLTIQSGTDTVAAGKCVRIRIGTNAVNQSTGVNQITNGSAGTSSITVGGTFTDAGILTIVIPDSDMVSITASVNETVTFDISVGATYATSNSPYAVGLGTLTSGSVTRSGNGGIYQIFLDGTTNASGGMNVSVRNANGTGSSGGLKSTSVPADTIPNNAGTMAAGTANYGICVDSANLTGFARATAYNTTCTVGGATNQIPALSATAADMLTSTAPLSNGRAYVEVNAAISTTTPAHADYADTLYFVATGSF